MQENSWHSEPPLPELARLRAPERSAHERARFHRGIRAAADPWLRRRREGPWWHILAAWAPRGLAAAAVMLLVIVGTARWAAPGEPLDSQLALEEILHPGDADRPPAWLLSSTEPDRDVVLAAALDRPDRDRR